MRTEAQRQASRINGSKSKGPITPEGKNITKFNGVTHGLCAEHVILPGEDPAAFELERQAWAGDWNPPSHTRAVLVERAAIASWRLRRAVRAERDVLAEFADEAGRRFDDDRRNYVERLAAQIEEDPAGILSRLRFRREGIDRIIKSWRELSRSLRDGHGGWNQKCDHERLMILLGHRRDDLAIHAGEDAVASGRLLAVNDPDRDVRPLGKNEGRELIGRLRRLAARHLRRLRAERLVSADPLEERAAAVAAAAAMAHASKDAQLRHRYEMDIDRVLRGTVNQLAMLTKSGVDLVEAPATSREGEAPPEPRPDASPGGRPDRGVDLPVSGTPFTVETSVAPGSLGAGDFGMIPGVSVVPISASPAPARARKRPRRGRSRR